MNRLKGRALGREGIKESEGENFRVGGAIKRFRCCTEKKSASLFARTMTMEEA